MNWISIELETSVSTRENQCHLVQYLERKVSCKRKSDYKPPDAALTGISSVINFLPALLAAKKCRFSTALLNACRDVRHFCLPGVPLDCPVD